MPDILSIIGAITGIVSLCAVVYGFAIWRGRVDLKLNTLWEFWLEGIKRSYEGQGYLAGGLTDRGHHVLPEDVKRQIGRTRKKGPCIALSKVGLKRAGEIAASEGIPLEHMVAIITAYFDEVNRQ